MGGFDLRLYESGAAFSRAKRFGGGVMATALQQSSCGSRARSFVPTASMYFAVLQSSNVGGIMVRAVRGGT